MSMFGLLYTGFALLCKGIVGVQNSVDNTLSKADSIKNNKLCYYDCNGAYRLVSNNEQVYNTTLSNGERVLKNNKGEIVHNFDIAKKQNALLREREEFHNKYSDEMDLIGAYEDIYPERVHKGNWRFLPAKGAIYKYCKNNKYYFHLHRFQREDVYIDAETGMYIWVKSKTGDSLSEEWVKSENEILNKIDNKYLTVKNVDIFIGV